jgi:hypothetical protein
MLSGLCFGFASRRLKKSPSLLFFLKQKDSSGLLGLCNVKIIQQNMLGGQPRDDDPVPEAQKMVSNFPLPFLVWASICLLLDLTSTSRQFRWGEMFRFSLKTMFRESGTIGLLMFNLLNRFSMTFSLMSNILAINTLACPRTAL